MVVEAIAGGTGAVGRAIVSAFISQDKHEVLVLSRTANPEKEKELGARFVATDYKDVATLIRLLEDSNVHTVISALNMMPTAGGDSELNLIEAADASKTTKRMVPSEYCFLQSPEDADIIPSIPTKRASIEALKVSKTLEWTVFHTGLFMDFFGMPKIPSHLNPFVPLLDMAGNSAAVPGNGDSKVTFTHTSDLGQFVAASIELEKWERLSVVIGDKMTINEAVTLAEEVKGTKFKVSYDAVEKLKKGEAAELPSQKELYSIVPKEVVQAITSRFGIWVERGEMDLDEHASLNRIMPELKTMKLKELLLEAWKQ